MFCCTQGTQTVGRKKKSQDGYVRLNTYNHFLMPNQKEKEDEENAINLIRLVEL